MTAQLSSPLTSDHVCFLSVAKISTKEVFHQKLISAVQALCYDPEMNTITVLECELDYEVVQYYSSSMVFLSSQKHIKLVLPCVGIRMPQDKRIIICNQETECVDKLELH